MGGRAGAVHTHGGNGLLPRGVAAEGEQGVPAHVLPAVQAGKEKGNGFYLVVFC